MSIRRRPLLTGVITCLATTGAALEQAARKVRRVGVLLNNIPWESLAWVAAALREMGYEECRNLLLDVRSAQGHEDRLAALAAELVAARVDLILAPLNPEILAARRATSTIPIVMMYAVAPVETGLVASLARPGGNITGTATNAPELAGKMIEILHDAVPRMTLVTAMADPDFPGMALYSRASETAAAALAVRYKLLPVRTVADLEQSLALLERDRPDAILVAMTGVLIAEVRRVIEFAARQRLPALYSTRSPVADGGLVSYAPDFVALGRRTVATMAKILNGAKPADISIEQPNRFKLTINLKTARAMGLAIPQSLLLRADEVIE